MVEEASESFRFSTQGHRGLARKVNNGKTPVSAAPVGPRAVPRGDRSQGQSSPVSDRKDGTGALAPENFSSGHSTGGKEGENL